MAKLSEKSNFTSVLMAEDHVEAEAWEIPEVNGIRIPLSEEEEEKRAQKKKKQQQLKPDRAKLAESSSPELKNRIKERQDMRKSAIVGVVDGEKEVEYRSWISSELEAKVDSDKQKSEKQQLFFTEIENLETKRKKEEQRQLSVLETARQEAWDQAYQEGLAKGLEEGQKKGFEEGHKEGYASGHTEGYATGETYVNELTEKFTQIMSTLSEPLGQLDEDMQTQLAEMIYLVAKKVILEELRLQPEHVLIVVKEAIHMLPVADRKATIFLHGDDVEEVTKILPEKVEWKIQQDDSLTAGGCRLETSDSTLDASIEKRLDEVISQLDD
jgi:flagellar assembly protein FliH